MQSTSRRSAADSVTHFGKVGDIELEQIPTLGACEPGIDEMTEYNLLIAPAVAKAKIGSILLADESRDSLDMAMQAGRIIMASPVAFNFEDWARTRATPPKQGDVVWFARYAGGEITGADGRTYRVLKDKDIMAIIRRFEGEPAQERSLNLA
jgi:co-chaperonin GroES (HSP10)